MIIVFCIDENFSKYVRVSIESYRKHNPNAKIITVSERRLKGLGEDLNTIIKLPKIFRNVGEKYRISNATYLKLFLTKLPYEKIIFVDADTVCQKSLDELWEIPCDYINLCESHSFGKKQAQDLVHKRYGCCGMMVMNLKALKQCGFTDKCLEVEENHETPSTGWNYDETCINIAMYDKLKFIDKKYCYSHNRKYDFPIPESEAYILHYIGWEKNAMLYGDKYKEIEKIGKDICGKRVAIIGNAKSLFDSKYGEEIDSYDFIIRFNKGFYVHPESQGTKTTMLILACNLSMQQMQSYKAKYIVNRSKKYYNPAQFTLSNKDRLALKEKLKCQPTTGFIAIDICIYFGAKSIDIYGFDFEETPTFYNPIDYKTPHDYPQEKSIVLDYQKQGILKIHKNNS